MEHVMKIAEAVLAVFGTGKFLHECWEVIHHIAKLVRK
jgi:hypothetical protein